MTITSTSLTTTPRDTTAYGMAGRRSIVLAVTAIAGLGALVVGALSVLIG
jgi:hypothetical protein